MIKYAQVVVNTPLGPLTTKSPEAITFEPPHDDDTAIESAHGDLTLREPQFNGAPNEIVEEGAFPESPYERAFTYSIPERLAAQIALGQLVWVPFGKRELQGIVVSFSAASPVAETKDLDSIVDPRPFLTQVHLDLAQWIAHTYLCTYHEAIRLMLPPGIEQVPEIFIALAPAIARDKLTEKQTALVELLARAGETKLRVLPRDQRAVVDALVKRGLVVKRTEIAPPKAKPKRVKTVRLVAEEPIANLKPAMQAKARAVAALLRAQHNFVWVGVIYAAVECDLAFLRKLETAGIIALEEEEQWRDSLAERTFEIGEPPTLTSEQAAAWQTITTQLGTAAHPAPRAAFLLHGVTGSGKTEIYMRALAHVIAQGKQGIVLVPEIALTPQTIRRFGARFQRMAVIHSRLGIGERFDAWRRCRDGLVDVVIGSRSALFAPLPKLGLIVLDEEHDPSYKQSDTPHYHARDTALELARQVGAAAILGSATPDVETYYRATRGELTLLTLPQRVMGHTQVIQNSEFQIPNSKTHYLDLPPVEIVDLRAELKAGNRSMFSRALQRALARGLAAHEQAILFLNRRGTATFILCRDCGLIFKCKRCNNPMTYHGAGAQLVCHHCNRRDRVPTQCPNCQSARIRYFGTGTEKVETEIQTLFPQARTLRWDLDVTRGQDSHEAILEKFVHRQADILIGTQMIAKGLDLPFVTLVGVISADTALNLPDFRAGERTFQLLTQVAGRAGRSILGGKVIVQTYNPEHYAIQAASTHDYAAFYAREIAFRREQQYPPYSHLIRLLYFAPSEKNAQLETTRLHRLLNERLAQRGLPALDLIGPAPAFFSRVRGEYRYQIILRGADPRALIADLALPLGWRVDVDPVSVL